MPLTPRSQCSAWRACSDTDLKKVMEIFSRMFFEPHSKVLSVFVETLVDFVSVHAADLAPWLPLLLPRLFIKLTSDLRGSIHSKVELALRAVRSFADFVCCLYIGNVGVPIQLVHSAGSLS